MSHNYDSCHNVKSLNLFRTTVTISYKNMGTHFQYHQFRNVRSIRLVKQTTALPNCTKYCHFLTEKLETLGLKQKKYRLFLFVFCLCVLEKYQIIKDKSHFLKFSNTLGNTTEKRTVSH